MYSNIEKSASSTTFHALTMQDGRFVQKLGATNDRLIANCSFTFVRDPIARFVSGYYTVNKLLYDKIILKNQPFPIVSQNFTFWRTKGTFVQNKKNKKTFFFEPQMATKNSQNS